MISRPGREENLTAQCHSELPRGASQPTNGLTYGEGSDFPPSPSLIYTDGMSVHDVPRLIALTLMAASTGGCYAWLSCGKPKPATETPLSFSDWNVTPERYAVMVMTVGGSGDAGGTGDTGDTGGPLDTTAWDELESDAQCRVACAYAAGLLDFYLHTDTEASYVPGVDSLTIHTCELTIPTADGDGSLSCTATTYDQPFCEGRRPLGWQADHSPITSLQRQLDGMAVMEQVSITAFLELAAQLDARGAPVELVARCRAATRDERRHVELLVSLGAVRPSAAPEPAAATTSLLEIALHNAVEGCAIETWAALLARHQAEHAPDPSVRAAFGRIAVDEARHAQLAWELHAWFIDVLEPTAASEVEAARAQALARLESMASQQALAVPRTVREALGLPEPRLASALASDFGRRLAQRPAA